MENNIKKLHTITIDNRKKVNMTGIEKVVSYSEHCLDCISSLGRLSVIGKNIKIDQFNNIDGSLILQGDIDSIKYAVLKPPIIKRIFK